MSESEHRKYKAVTREEHLAYRKKRAQELKAEGKTNADLAKIFGVAESSIRSLLEKEEE